MHSHHFVPVKHDSDEPGQQSWMDIKDPLHSQEKKTVIKKSKIHEYYKKKTFKLSTYKTLIHSI